MFKFLFKLFLFIDFLFLNLVAGSFFLPIDFHVERDIVIDGTPAEIFEYVGTLETWNDWSYWSNKNEKFPNLKSTFEGPKSGVGAKSLWTDSDSGFEHSNGQMEIVKADPQTGIDTIIEFEGMEGQLLANFRFEAAGDKTKVTWSADGKNEGMPLFRYMGFAMDYMLGPCYEAGLKGLKAKVEGTDADDAKPKAAEEEAPAA